MADQTPRPSRILIAGAAGRDFHNFNVCYRDDPGAVVVGFTATQIPGIGGRTFPAALAGPRYPHGIPVEDEADLEAICHRERVDRVAFAYSDVSHAAVMHLASRALAAGADFEILGPDRTMLAARVPVIAVTAVRTGCGKSQVARWLSQRVREAGRRCAVLRHPMPYGDFARQRVQRFETVADLAAADCTIEEREEYEPHIAAGNVVFAGIDYRAILDAAEAEADLIIWDGGNNDFPFVRPDLHIALVDALRPDQVATHHPGETVARMADVILVAKSDAAGPDATEAATAAARAVNPRAAIVRGASPVRLDDPRAVAGRRVLVVEDGPTLTHGDMRTGAGYAAASAAGVGAIVDPRISATPALREVFARYPHIGPVLPAVGYDAAQVAALRQTIEDSDAEAVIAATPVDLAALLATRKPVVRVRYDYADADDGDDAPTLGAIVDSFLARSRNG